MVKNLTKEIDKEIETEGFKEVKILEKAKS